MLATFAEATAAKTHESRRLFRWLIFDVRLTIVKPLLRIVAALASLSGSARALAADGKEVFETHCAPCHGRDGKGRTPAGRKIGAKDLAASRIADGEIARQVIEGTKDAKGNPRMPAFREKLSADDLEALVSFVKKFRK